MAFAAIRDYALLLVVAFGGMINPFANHRVGLEGDHAAVIRRIATAIQGSRALKWLSGYSSRAKRPIELGHLFRIWAGEIQLVAGPRMPVYLRQTRYVGRPRRDQRSIVRSRNSQLTCGIFFAII